MALESSWVSVKPVSSSANFMNDFNLPGFQFIYVMVLINLDTKSFKSKDVLLEL